MKSLRAVILSTLLVPGGLLANPPDGILDPGFGTDAVASASFNLSANLVDRTYGMAVASSGRIYLAATVGMPVQGEHVERLGLIRFTASGQLDNAFSGDGLSAPSLAAFGTQNLTAFGALVRADGKPLVYGVRHNLQARPKIVICRFAVAGNLDPSYDGDGCAEPTLALLDNGEEAALTALSLPDERVLMGGLASTSPANPNARDALALMLKDDGSVDTSFGTSGYVLLRPPGTQTRAQLMDLQRLPDGRFIVVGVSDAGLFVSRLSATGQLDMQFGVNGYAKPGFADLHSLPQPRDWVRASAVDSQGRIYVCGYVTYENSIYKSVMAFARLTPNGTLDSSFSGDGRVLRPFIDVYPVSLVTDCALDGQGRLTVAVQTGTHTPLSNDFGALRLLPNGSEDPSFGAIGQTRIPIDLGGNGIGQDDLAAMALVGDQILLAGTSYPDNSNGTATGEVHTIVRLGSDRHFASGFED